MNSTKGFLHDTNNLISSSKQRAQLRYQQWNSHRNRLSHLSLNGAVGFFFTLRKELL